MDPADPDPAGPMNPVDPDPERPARIAERKIAAREEVNSPVGEDPPSAPGEPPLSSGAGTGTAIVRELERLRRLESTLEGISHRLTTSTNSRTAGGRRPGLGAALAGGVFSAVLVGGTLSLGLLSLREDLGGRSDRSLERTRELAGSLEASATAAEVRSQRVATEARERQELAESEQLRAGRAAACGAQHTLAVTVAGELYAFGDNEFRQLGLMPSNDGDAPHKDKPMKVYLLFLYSCLILCSACNNIYAIQVYI